MYFVTSSLWDSTETPSIFASIALYARNFRPGGGAPQPFGAGAVMNAGQLKMVGAG